MNTIYRSICLILICITLLLNFPLKAEAVNSPRRGVECRIISKLYSSVKEQVKGLENAAIAQQFALKLEADMQTLNLEDETLEKIQVKYVSDFHEMAMILKNIREGQLVGDQNATDRMMPYYTMTAIDINKNSQELNGYCQKVWGYKPLPES